MERWVGTGSRLQQGPCCLSDSTSSNFCTVVPQEISCPQEDSQEWPRAAQRLMESKNIQSCEHTNPMSEPGLYQCSWAPSFTGPRNSGDWLEKVRADLNLEKVKVQSSRCGLKPKHTAVKPSAAPWCTNFFSQLLSSIGARAGGNWGPEQGR